MLTRTLVELLHILAGLAATALIVEGSAWAYPLGAGVIRSVGWVAAVVVILMGINSLRRAWAIDARARAKS